MYQPGCTGMNLLSSLKSGNGGLYVGNNQCGARKDIFPVNGQRRYQYKTDGTGRDTYISLDNGGFYPKTEVAEYKKMDFFE